MDNFIEDNDFCDANMIFKQDVNFTYANGNSHSYIDHILVPDFCRELIMNCTILNGDAANVNDHLALSLSMKFPSVVESQHVKYMSMSTKPDSKRKPNWCDVQFQRRFSEQLDQNLCKVSLICMEDLTSREEAATSVNKVCEYLCKAIHDATDSAILTFPDIPSKQIVGGILAVLW